MKKNRKTMVITGTRKGIGRWLAEYYLKKGYRVYGCSRQAGDLKVEGYRHFRLDIADEARVKSLFDALRREEGGLDVLINNAGVASMNHMLLTPLRSVETVLKTNVTGTFLFSREAAKLMSGRKAGRIVNIGSVATPLKLEGEAIYASSKAAVISLTEIMARELADFGITVNALGLTPVRTDLIRSVPEEKLDRILERQAIHRFGELRDITNVIDFFIKPASGFVTGQVIYLGGV